MLERANPQKRDNALLGTSPNRWDWALLPLVLAVLMLLAFGAMQMTRPFEVGEPSPMAGTGSWGGSFGVAPSWRATANERRPTVSRATQTGRSMVRIGGTSPPR